MFAEFVKYSKLPPKDHPTRIYKNDILEFFTHVHPAMPAIVFVPVIYYFFYSAYVFHGLSVGQILLVAPLALLVWSLTEYTLHRFVFHLPDWGPLVKQIEFSIHGAHHDFPDDKTRLVLPTLPAIFLAFLFYHLFEALMGPVWAAPFFAFFVTGYLVYDYTHYATHHWTPLTAWGRMIKKNHMAHHFADKKTRWGVSSPLWDYVFRTFESGKEESPKAAETSPQH